MKYILVVAIVLCVSSVVHGATDTWLYVFGGYSRYMMEDVVDLIDTMPIGIDPIESGSTYGASLGVDVSEKVSLGLGYEHLDAESKGQESVYSVVVDVPADIVSIFANYWLESSDRLRAGLGGAIGRISTNGEIVLTEEGDGTNQVRARGASLSVEVNVCAQFWVVNWLGISAAGGYRYAKIGEIESNGERLFNPDGSEFTVDYSGILFRAGLIIKFPDVP